MPRRNIPRSLLNGEKILLTFVLMAFILWESCGRQPAKLGWKSCLHPYAFFLMFTSPYVIWIDFTSFPDLKIHGRAKTSWLSLINLSWGHWYAQLLDLDPKGMQKFQWLPIWVYWYDPSIHHRCCSGSGRRTLTTVDCVYLTSTNEGRPCSSPWTWLPTCTLITHTITESR